jgi:hypothetical protein
LQTWNSGAGVSLWFDVRAGQLPGQGGAYPVVKTDYAYQYFSAGGYFTSYIVGSTGQYVPVGSASWLKKDIKRSKNVLNRLLDVPIYDWKHKDDDEGMIGPMALDFYGAFPELKLHSSNALAPGTGLSYSDRIGVLEAATQELAAESRRGDTWSENRLDSLEEAIVSVAQEVGALKKQLAEK